MNRDIARIVRRYKMPLLLGSLALLITFFAAVGTAGYLAYQFGAFATEKVTVLQKGSLDTVAKINAGQEGFVKDFLISLARGWFQQELTSEDLARYKAGLACFDALGGPSPKIAIGYLKSQVEDRQVQVHLDALEKSLDLPKSQQGGAASCAAWILSS